MPKSYWDDILAPMTELILIRHGQTPGNAAGLLEGWNDKGLTALGTAQARAVAHRLAGECDRDAVAALYTSPLRRALRTARIVGEALGQQPVSVEGLREINFGELSDVPVKNLETHYPELFARWSDRMDASFQWPGGEQRGEFMRRVARACDAILARHPDECVVVVAHSGTLRMCLAHLLPNQLGRWWEFGLDNCGLTRVSVTASGARLVALNDTAHLGE